MSKVEIEIPDDGWFPRESESRPQDKQLCIVILAGGCVKSAQYMKNLYGINDIFRSLNMPTYFSWNVVDRWKPLDLPADMNERILAEIAANGLSSRSEYEIYKGGMTCEN